ncbi:MULTISPECIES: MSMEG_1061 family FMN-dependent PPOX-type flavoprotein [unclassified Agromyces]|uniref:MSMEG_1061 family FMN-dependent PPOX-type flavoprotein n=1 Tax=unclassified Agromyces TaxID=2639701 RepID=UPI003014576C
MSARGIPVTTADELEAIVGTPIPRVAEKTRDRLHEVDREWLAAASLAVVATSDEHGRLDVSPKGDPAGFALVLDDTTIAVPERPGNRRADGFHNILRNPRVGLLFAVPGRGDTLRINGRATIVRDAPFLDGMAVRGHRPQLALVVDVEEVFFHCSKAFLRSRAWDPETWQPDAVRRRALIAKAIEQPAAELAELDAYYGPSYAERIYR